MSSRHTSTSGIDSGVSQEGSASRQGTDLRMNNARSEQGAVPSPESSLTLHSNTFSFSSDSSESQSSPEGSPSVSSSSSSEEVRPLHGEERQGTQRQDHPVRGPNAIRTGGCSGARGRGRVAGARRKLSFLCAGDQTSVLELLTELKVSTCITFDIIIVPSHLKTWREIKSMIS